MRTNDGAQPTRTSLKRQQIASSLTDAITSGRYENGALLPAEQELAIRFDVSRGTVRRALEDLARADLIDTRTGIGSFVTFDGKTFSDPSSWGRALADSGIATSTHILRCERITDADLAAELGRSELDFIALDRLRRDAAGVAVSLERSRVPALGRLAEAPHRGLVDDSLSATLRASGLVPSAGEQWISAGPLGEADATLLGRAPGTFFLHSTRVARTTDGSFAEKVTSWLDPEHFRIHLNFGASHD
jgi:GntR family transcriptional regulator